MEASSNLRIESLLKKYIEGKADSNDKHELFNLLEAQDNEDKFKEILLRGLTEYNEEIPDTETDVFKGIYNNILHDIKQNKTDEPGRHDLNRNAKIKRILIYCSGIAALFIIAFSIGHFSSMLKKDISSNHLLTPGYTEIYVPFGSKSRIRLPDGSLIMLNAGSTLKYSNDFNISNRDLILAGEGYFKVAKNTAVPFNVNAGNINIKAVGTEFNVKAYDEEGIIETTLVEGKVEITQPGQDKDGKQYLGLAANQKAIYIKESGTLTLEKIKAMDSSAVAPVKAISENILISSKVDVKQVVAWTQGKLIIRSENLDNLCVELKRKYDVNFIFRNEEIKKYRFSGVLLDETIEQVLNVIKLTSPIDYSLDGKTVFLSTNQEQIGNYSKHLK